MAKIIKVEQTVPTIKTKKKVAAYARVSMESERMNHSLSAQISYYSTLIQKNPNWQYAGVFADEDFTGVSGREYKIELSGTVYKDGYGEAISKTTTKTCP